MMQRWQADNPDDQGLLGVLRQNECQKLYPPVSSTHKSVLSRNNNPKTVTFAR